MKPTTAGLLKFPSLPDSGEQVLAPRSLSPEFKQELQAKQLSLMSANSDATSIEEKIRRNKMINFQCRSNNISSSNGRNQFQHEQQQLIPEKLMSAMQKETKPFAYTVNVSDPNNRGKLDLSQIKSPTMRRRLLANMESAEEKEDDDCYEDDDDDDNNNVFHDDDDNEDDQSEILRRSETISPQTIHGHHQAQRADRHRKNAIKTISFSPVVSFSYADDSRLQQLRSPEYRGNQRQILVQSEQESRRPIIRYNEPPKFYNNYPDSSSSSDTQVRFNSSSQRSSRQTSDRSTVDRLDAEMAETLDDFERMLSNMSFDSESPSSRAAPFQQAPRVQHHTRQQNNWFSNSQQAHHDNQQPAWNQVNSQIGNGDCLSCLNSRPAAREERTSRGWLRTFQA